MHTKRKWGFSAKIQMSVEIKLGAHNCVLIRRKEMNVDVTVMVSFGTMNFKHKSLIKTEQLSSK